MFKHVRKLVDVDKSILAAGLGAGHDAWLLCNKLYYLILCYKFQQTSDLHLAYGTLVEIKCSPCYGRRC